MRSLSRIISKVSYFSGLVLMWLPWILMLIIVWEVTLRNVAGKPTLWAHELSSMVFGALTILSGAYALREKSHVNMDLFYMRLTNRGKAILDIITFPLFFVFCSVLLWLGWDFAARSVMLFEESISNWHPPIWPVKLTLPLGALLLLLQGIAKFIDDLMIVINGERPLE